MMNTATVEPTDVRQREYRWVSIGDMFRPEQLQRPMDEARITKMLAAYNDDAFGTPILSYREHGNRGPRGETYAIVSGQHRIELARRLGRTSIYCEVLYGMDVAAEARLFNDEDNRKRQDVVHKFHLDRLAGDTTALTIWQTCLEVGFDIPKSSVAWQGKNDIKCVAALAKALNAGVLRAVLETVKTAFPDMPGAATAPIIGGLTTLFAARGDLIDRKRLAAKLGALGPGALFRRYASSREVSSHGQVAGVVMANVMIDAYNAHLRDDDRILDYITRSERSSGAGRRQTPVRVVTGKTLAEARAEVAARRAAGEAV